VKERRREREGAKARRREVIEKDRVIEKERRWNG
jgi:hypothetical protein